MRTCGFVVVSSTIGALAAVTLGATDTPTAILQDTGSSANAFADAAMTIPFDRFDRPGKSGTGNYWILLARNTLGSSADTMFITGTGSSYNLVTLEGVTDYGAGQTFNTSDRYVDINDSGDWVGIGNLNGGPSVDDEVVYSGNVDGSTLSLPFREGDVIGTGATLGSGNYGPSISDAGAISFGWSDPAASTSITYYTDDGNTAALADGDSVTGAVDPFSTQSFGGRNAYQTTPDGSSYVVRGNLGSSSGLAVLIKDGVVVLAEGDAFPVGKIVDQILGEQNILQANGDWLTRVRFTDGTGGAIRNGVLLAQSGDAVNGSVPGERFSEAPWTSSPDTTFAVVTGDSAGNVVLGGFTDNPNTDANFVWTYNGHEFLRYGDQIDLDGDGTLDNAFIFNSNYASASPSALGGFIADDGVFYTNVEWRSADGTVTGDAFIYVNAVSAAPCPWDCAPPGGNGVINIDDVLQVINEFGMANGACDNAPDNGDGTFGNGIVNIDDLLGVINNFGECP